VRAFCFLKCHVVFYILLSVPPNTIGIWGGNFYNYINNKTVRTMRWLYPFNDHELKCKITCLCIKVSDSYLEIP
jgi:hypothetical protein